MQFQIGRRQWPSDLGVQEDWGDGMCWIGGWCLLHLVLLQGHASGMGVIPNKAAQGMQESPLSPLSRVPI